jgi:uncharacterized protein YndB with AHSA1/START domain
MDARTTQLTRRMLAPPHRVFEALLDARAVPAWKVPTGMRCRVHLFEPREGGRFRVSLTYEDPEPAGKTSAHTDTYAGHFERIVEAVRVVEVLAFETSDPAIAGEMRITYELVERDGGTDLTATHEQVPPGIALQDNHLGWSIALDRLAALVEAPPHANRTTTGSTQ